MSAQVHRSVSTWQQPTPPPGSAQRTELVAEVAKSIMALGEHRLRVAIDGLSASGKTSFGHEIAEHIAQAGRPVLRASLDDFKKPWRDRHLYDRESGEGYYRNAFDFPAVTKLLLEPAGPQGSGVCALCGIDPLTGVDHSTETITAPPDSVLIVDGVFAFRPELNDHWDMRIWMDIDADESVRRGSERDEHWEGFEAAEAVHRDRYLAGMRIYQAEVDPIGLADVVIDNRTLDRPRRAR